MAQYVVELTWIPNVRFENVLMNVLLFRAFFGNCCSPIKIVDKVPLLDYGSYAMPLRHKKQMPFPGNLERAKICVWTKALLK